MKKQTPRWIGRALGLLACLAGCSDGSDACEGQTETCLSLTLEGAEGVSAADQLQLFLWRKERPISPMTPLGSAQEFPFKVAVLWPDGPANFSVRSFLQGKANGVSAELTLDLRGGQHAQRRLTLFPPLPTSPLPDLGPPKDFVDPPDLDPPKDADPSDLPNPSDLPDQADLPASVAPGSLPKQALPVLR